MQKFFINSRDIEQSEITISGSDAAHISRSLRMAPGEKIMLGDGEGNDCVCEIVGFTPDTVTVRVLQRMRNGSEPPYRAVLYQALAKGEKMDYIVQKATELGVSEIIPFESRRCIVRLRDGHGEKKRERWQRIAEEAAKQCGRGIIPRVGMPVGFEEAVREAESDGAKNFICYEEEKNLTLASVGRSDRYGFFIGPEGGFESVEAELAARAGITPVSLGPRILRCESASGFVLSCLCFMNELGGQN